MLCSVVLYAYNNHDKTILPLPFSNTPTHLLFQHRPVRRRDVMLVSSGRPHLTAGREKAVEPRARARARTYRNIMRECYCFPSGLAFLAAVPFPWESSTVWIAPCGELTFLPMRLCTPFPHTRAGGRINMSVAAWSYIIGTHLITRCGIKYTRLNLEFGCEAVQALLPLHHLTETVGACVGLRWWDMIDMRLLLCEFMRIPL